MREKLIELLKDTRANAAWHHWGYEESADHLIANGVTIPVRCKDCKCLHITIFATTQFCSLSGITVEDDDFCSYGERKDNG